MIYNGHPDGAPFYESPNIKSNAKLYHTLKHDIDIVAFDELIEQLRLLIIEGTIWQTPDPAEALRRILDRMKNIVKADLPQDWMTLLKDLKEKGADMNAIDTYLSLLHCAKGTSYGAAKTSDTGVAKSVGMESARSGIGLFPLYNTL